MAGEEERWAAEVDSAENHKKLLEKKVMDGHDEATEQLKAAQQQSVQTLSLHLSLHVFRNTCLH